jgi:hypothetical protein
VECIPGSKIRVWCPSKLLPSCHQLFAFGRSCLVHSRLQLLCRRGNWAWKRYIRDFVLLFCIFFSDFAYRFFIPFPNFHIHQTSRPINHDSSKRKKSTLTTAVSKHSNTANASSAETSGNILIPKTPLMLVSMMLKCVGALCVAGVVNWPVITRRIVLKQVYYRLRCGRPVRMMILEEIDSTR